jgi:membrane dipeptidase
MYREICKTGGTAGINMADYFLGENPDLNTVCDHIFHFLEIAGNDKHISLGGDLDGVETLPAGFTSIQDYDKLAERLLQRGLKEESVENIFWNNAIGVIKKCST